MRLISVLVLTLILFPSVLYAQERVIQSPVSVECGDIIESEFTLTYEQHPYELSLNAGDSVSFDVQPLGRSLQTRLAITDPSGSIIIRQPDPNGSSLVNTEAAPMVNTGILGANGIYGFYVINYDLIGTTIDDPGGVGVYTIFIGCTLRDGTIIEPGDNLVAESPVDTSDAPAPQSNFTGFGFPGVPSVDFSAGIEIPLESGQAQTVPLASDVALYTYDASTSEDITLNILRVSGDISIGVTVINKDTNEIIFIGGLPSSNNLSVDLTFPSDGTYAIGLFRLDTTERTGTSGAVQILIE